MVYEHRLYYTIYSSTIYLDRVAAVLSLLPRIIEMEENRINKKPVRAIRHFLGLAEAQKNMQTRK